MSRAYIIKNNEVICWVDTELSNGTHVEFSKQKSKEELDASIDFRLVNARSGKISRAKKWQAYRHEIASYGLMGTEINPREFYIESLYQEED